MNRLTPSTITWARCRGRSSKLPRRSLFHRRFWTPATAAAGVAPLRIHDLRHTAVAYGIAAGTASKEIARRAGHASVVTVLDRYGHQLPGEEDRVTDALDLMAQAAVARSSQPLTSLRVDTA